MDHQLLKNRRYYEDLYDLTTIKKCLWSNDFWAKEYKKAKADNQKDKLKAINIAYDYDIYFIKGERWKNKQETINNLIQEDQEKQEFYDNTSAPSDIFCPTCGAELLSDFKTLDDFSDKPLRVIFFFPCNKCHKKVAFYNTGEERISKLDPCPKCSNEIKTSIKRDDDKITWTRKCGNCNFKEIDIEDLEKDQAERREKDTEGKRLLEKYRSTFCLSDEEGGEYVESIANLKQLEELIIRHKEKDENKELYNKVAALKKLTVVDLEKILADSLEKEKYMKFELSSPEFGQQVIVTFTVRDAGSKSEYDSKNILKKLINKTLLDTNWRLMTEGINYRIGFLQGRLKAYEKEEDLIKLVQDSEKKNGKKQQD
ncbi:MAG: hypothetical protein M1365_12490 [Actinobacteria bacterium]|nr:hypothetical protein [Actinomycetota bacterium]